MAEVEDVPGATAGAREHVGRLLLDDGPRGEQGSRVEVPLYRAAGQTVPRLVEPDAPVEANRIPARLGHRLQQPRRPRAEVDRWGGGSRQHPRRPRCDVRSVVGGREHSDP